MVDRDAGSVIITENGKAMGIITERDLVKSVITGDRKPSEVDTSEILSTPLLTVDPTTSIVEAAKMMLRANVKRLPVLENGAIIGVISNTDILMITPGLNTILKDLIDMNRELFQPLQLKKYRNQKTSVLEYVSLAMFSYDLRFVDGRYLCGNCRQEEGEDYE